MSVKTLTATRKFLATLVFVAFVALFCSAPIPGLEKLAALQIGPAILAGSVVFLLVQALAAALFGRVYCSLLCPLGITQDFLAIFRKKRLYKPREVIRILRYGVLAVFVASLISGYLVAYNALDPYSVFGRIANAVFAPILSAVSELVARAAEFFNISVSFGGELAFSGWPVLLIALASLAILIALVLKYGREWCNYCPAGTLLGFIAQKSLFRIRLDATKCVSCGLCQKTCKTGCIDIYKKTVSADRCVACLDCASVCPKKALAYSASSAATETPAASAPRRSFLNGVLPGLILAAASAGEVRAAEKEIVIKEEKREAPRRENPVSPPGSDSLERYARHCAGCQLCASVCPNGVLLGEDFGAGLIQPTLNFTRGYCRPNCAKCGEVCPTGAIRPFSLEEKKRVRLGLAGIARERCIINRDNLPCTACQRICPQEAITLVKMSDDGKAPKQPVVDSHKCTGCGACEYVCPSRPVAAITVNGFPVHKRSGESV